MQNKKEHPSLSRHWIKIVFLSTFGSFLDFFDFSIFALFAPTIGQVFFTNDSHLIGLIKSFGILAIGYLARPLGGFLFGWWGDRQGRKKVFVSTILTMSLSTLMIGLLPGYATLGIWAAVLLLALRLIQGLSFGGELPGAVVFTAEHLQTYRGFGTSFMISALNLGAAFAAGMGGLLASTLSLQQMAEWGWRIPFFFGFFIGIIGFWVRKSTTETPVFEQLKKETIQKYPLVHLLKNHFPSFLIGLSLTGLSATVSSFMIFFPSYFSLILHRPLANGYLLMSVLSLVLALSGPPFGYFSDRTGRRFWLVASAMLVAGVSFFLFHLDAMWLWVLLPLCDAPNVGCFEIALVELFPANIRYSGVGVCHNLGYGIFVGFGPLIYTLLYHLTGDPASPFYYLLFGAMVTFSGALFLKKNVNI